MNFCALQQSVTPVSMEVAAASTEVAASKDREIHIWTDEEIEYLLGKLNTVEKQSEFKKKNCVFILLLQMR